MKDIFSRIVVGDSSSYLQLIEDVDLNSKSKEGLSMLQLAIGYRRNEIAMDLINRGIEINNKNYEEGLEIHTALWHNLSDVAIRLIQAGSDLQHRNNHGNDALWYAATHPKRNLEIVRMILQRGGNPMVKNNAGRSVYDAAHERNDIALLELLGAPDENFGEK